MAAAVAVVISCGEEILFTRRSQEPKKGKLDLAGGFVDPDEDAEEACARELFEEMKLKVDRTRLRYLGSRPNVYEYKNIAYNTLDLFFGYELNEKFEGELDHLEISETVWLDKESINLDELAFDSQKEFLKNHLNLE